MTNRRVNAIEHGKGFHIDWYFLKPLLGVGKDQVGINRLYDIM